MSTRDGRWFTVRVMPYRTLDDRIDGVVITFGDISVAKKLEGKLRHKHDALENRLADQSAEIAQAQSNLKAERKRRRDHDGELPRSAKR